jgi:thymidylate synthase (FAD)
VDSSDLSVSLKVRRGILDHGYVQLVEKWGSDEQIVEAARMSTGKGFLGWGPKTVFVRQCSECMVIEDEPGGKDECFAHQGVAHHYGLADIERQKPGDEKLLLYLWSHRHTTPFEMAGATFEVQAPIFVFREWHRHRTQSYNEMSARYVPLPDVNYLPKVQAVLERCKAAVLTTNRQAGGDEKRIPTVSDLQQWQRLLENAYGTAQAAYEFGLRIGVPKEVARLPVPVGRYSRMRVSTDLWNWLHFITLRCAADAQWEIRQYANAVRDELFQLFPRTMKLWNEGDARA